MGVLDFGECYMSRIRAIFVYIFIVLAEAGLIYQAKEPIYCTGTIFIMKLTGGNQLEKSEYIRQMSHVIVGVVCLVACIGLLLMAIDLFGGRSKGLLKDSYILMAVYHAIQVGCCILIYTLGNYYNNVGQKGDRRAQQTNMLLYFISQIIMLIILFVLILRELGLIRVINKLSAVLILVMLGQILSNGLLIDGIYPKWFCLFNGVVTALPTLAIFIFEAFIVEASVRKQT